MAPQTSLDLLKESSAVLVAQELRSDAAVIARLAALIAEAVRMGHSHCSIHSAIASGGLAISWTNYRIALGRARKALRSSEPSLATTPALPSTVGSGANPVKTSREVEGTFSLPAESGEMGNSGGSGSTTFSAASSAAISTPASITSSANAVMDALRRAREVASKDYTRIALDLHRQKQRDRQRKDPQ